VIALHFTSPRTKIIFVPLDFCVKTMRTLTLLIVRDLRHFTALPRSARMRRSNFFFEYKSNANMNFWQSWTPLQIATQKNQIAMIEVVVQNGADVNIGDVDGLTPLHFAAQADPPQAVSRLQALKADRVTGFST
jgi:ankyrin repeat protein